MEIILEIKVTCCSHFAYFLFPLYEATTKSSSTPSPPPSDGILVHTRGSQGIKLCIGIRWTLPTSKLTVFLKLRNKKTF